MSRRRVYTDETLAIMERFFATIADLLEKKRLQGGLQGFCVKNDIDKRHLYLQRAERNRGFFEVSWLLPLINDYGVSSQWLLLGKGKQYV